MGERYLYCYPIFSGYVQKNFYHILQYHSTYRYVRCILNTFRLPMRVLSLFRPHIILFVEVLLIKTKLYSWTTYDLFNRGSWCALCTKCLLVGSWKSNEKNPNTTSIDKPKNKFSQIASNESIFWNNISIQYPVPTKISLLSVYKGTNTIKITLNFSILTTNVAYYQSMDNDSWFCKLASDSAMEMVLRTENLHVANFLVNALQFHPKNGSATHYSTWWYNCLQIPPLFSNIQFISIKLIVDLLQQFLVFISICV